MSIHPGNIGGKPPLGLKQDRPREPKTRKAIKAKPQRISAADRAHLAAVAALPCVICWKPGPSEVHHVICGRYSQRRAPHTQTIPLCAECHRIGPNAIHENKTAWVERNGADHEFLPLVADMLAGEANQI